MRTYKHLSCEERTLIQLSLEQGCKLRTIAHSLHRAPSSISRELRRNWPRRRDRAVRCLLAAIVRRAPSSAPVTWQARRNSPPGWTRRGRCGRRSNDCCVS
ncbi:MAG: helix-turn-helix domain-containing protein, partial [Burkholderia sp.]